MKEIFNFIGRLIFVIMVIEIIRMIWKGSFIGKIILLSLLVFGVYQTYFNQPKPTHYGVIKSN
jgi:hypothetical protein